MTPKCSLFVDAGYLLASSASRLTGTSLRSGIHVKYRRLIRGLIKAAEETTGLPVLRVHWYDSAKDGVPDRSQERIGELPKVKLRLGRFGYDGQQKGVDLRLGLDMVAHAHHKAAEVFLLVSGDDDLTEAVEDVQVHGVTVLVLAVPGADGQPHGVSRHLVRAADEIITLDPAVIDEAIIPIETPEQAKDDGVELAHHPDLLLMKPRVPTDNLALIADAMVFGNASRKPQPAAASPGEATEVHSPHDDDDVIDLRDVELLLNAAHLDDSAQLAEAAEIAEAGGAVLLGNSPTSAGEAYVVDTLETASGWDQADETQEFIVPLPEPSEPAPTPPAPISPGSTPPGLTESPELLIPKPGPKPAAASGGETPAPGEVGVVTEALNRMWQVSAGTHRPPAIKPTPRDVSSSIGRPAERPIRPTYSTGPDNPKQGTWAAQWSEVIDSVVGRVLNSLTKSTTVDTWNIIGMGRPSIPQEIDKALLLDATEAMGVYTLSDAERHEVRAAFWQKFDQIKR